MTLFFTITLYVSVVALLLIIGLKRFELNTGRVVFASMRPMVRRGMHGVVLFTQYIVPFMARRSLIKTGRAARMTLTAALARAILYVEALLAHMLHTIQHSMQPKRGGTASSFLQEVADHKRKLLKSPVEKRAIFEEFPQ